MKSSLSLFFAAACAAVFLSAIPAAGQTAAARIPRMSDGKPNLSGLWQAMGTADWDIEAHSAAAGPFYQLGRDRRHSSGAGHCGRRRDPL